MWNLIATAHLYDIAAATVKMSNTRTLAGKPPVPPSKPPAEKGDAKAPTEIEPRK